MNVSFSNVRLGYKQNGIFVCNPNWNNISFYVNSTLVSSNSSKYLLCNNTLKVNEMGIYLTKQLSSF